MTRRVLGILLAVSVALNASFVAGFVYYRHVLRRLETAEGQVQWLARRLRLDDGQRQTVGRLHQQWRETLGQVELQHGPGLEAFWAEAVKDEPDRDLLRARLSPLLDAQRETTVRGVDHLLQVFELLSPDQRRALVEIIKKKERTP